MAAGIAETVAVAVACSAGRACTLVVLANATITNAAMNVKINANCRFFSFFLLGEN
ncbi:MAG: hypothetical protein ACRESZ_16270 [Methylococcales bacterium]